MAIQRPILDYQPDGDPLQQGAIISGTNFIPTMRGIGPAPTEVEQNIGLADGTALTPAGIAALINPLDGNAIIYCGTQDRLYALSNGTTWATVSAAFTNCSSWDFCMGPYKVGAIAVAPRHVPWCTGTAATGATFETRAIISGQTAFTDLSPFGASYIEHLDNRIFIANCVEIGSASATANATVIPFPDMIRWTTGDGSYEFCSAAAMAGGFITYSDCAGPITALRRFGNAIFVGKKTGCAILGKDSSGVFSLTSLETNDGPVSKKACIMIGSIDFPVLFFVGSQGFYIYDGTTPNPQSQGGSRPKPIALGLAKTVYAEMTPGATNNISVAFDAERKLIYVAYPADGFIWPTKCVVLHYPSGRWGRANHAAKYAFQWDSADTKTYGMLMDTLISYTYGSLPMSQTYAEFFGNDPTPRTRAAIVRENGTIAVLDGAAATAHVELGPFGLPECRFLIQSTRPVWMTKPTTAKATFVVKETPAETGTTAGVATMSASSRFDKLVDGRFHSISLSCTGEWELARLDVIGRPSGD